VPIFSLINLLNIEMKIYENMKFMKNDEFNCFEVGKKKGYMQKWLYNIYAFFIFCKACGYDAFV
jgi:hypothetical protein